MIKYAYEFLDMADIALIENNIDKGWQCFQGAHRMEIKVLNNAEIITKAIILREESNKLSSWRKNALSQIIGTSDNPKNNINNNILLSCNINS